MKQLTSMAELVRAMEANKAFVFRNGNVINPYDIDNMSMALTLRHLEDGHLFIKED